MRIASVHRIWSRTQKLQAMGLPDIPSPLEGPQASVTEHGAAHPPDSESLEWIVRTPGRFMRMTVRASFWLGVAWEQSAPPFKVIGWALALTLSGAILAVARHAGVSVAGDDVLQSLLGRAPGG